MNNAQPRIFVAGHRGLVGSAIVRVLRAQGLTNLVTRARADLELTDQAQVRAFFETERIDQVYLAAAKVGGIHANYHYPAEFIYDNMMVQANVVHEAWRSGVHQLLFLGSSCIYPRLAEQPIREESLMNGTLEPTNEPYAMAKIAGIKLCESYNRQYGTDYRSVMPTNLYGPGDNYHPQNSHVIPALIRRFHEAKLIGAEQVVIWGSGAPRREFLYSGDMADACVFLMNLPDERYTPLLGSDEATTGRFEPPLVNIGVGHDVTIAELAALVAQVVGYRGQVAYDTSQPDGTPRKLMDVSLLNAAGWKASTPLEAGLRVAYTEFAASLAKAG